MYKGWGNNKPVLGTGIDYSHPLAPSKDGLVFLLNELGGEPRDIVQGLRLPSRGVAGVQYYPSNTIVVNATDGAFMATLPQRTKDSVVASGKLSLVCRLKINAYSGGNAQGFTIPYDTAASSPFISFGMYDTGTQLQLAAAPGATFSTPAALTLTAGRWYVVAMTANGAEFSVFQDQFLVSRTQSGGPVMDATSFSATSQISFGEPWSSARTPNFSFDWGYIYPGRVLSNTEINDLVMNPFQFLIRPKRSRIAFTAAAVDRRPQRTMVFVPDFHKAYRE